jgi:Tfp pilus assembly ATPase PilU
VNAFYRLGKLAFVMRRIEQRAKTMDELGLPAGLSKILAAKQ